MVDEAARVEPLETGGVLLGWHAPDEADMVVTTTVGPGPRARHKRTRFAPDTAWQRKEVARLYDEHGRVLRYMGDWHSHPAGTTTPSGRDERTARKISRNRAARCSTPLMLILAGGPRDWRLAPHRYIERRLRPIGWETVAKLNMGKPAVADARLRATET